MINYKNIKSLFLYDNGNLFWKISPSTRIKSGSKAGTAWSKNKNREYTKIIYRGKGYFLHRLVWIYHNGDIPSGLVIDHIDGKKDNNRIENLRLITQQKNCHNRVGSFGVTKYYTNPKKKDRVKYRVAIVSDGVRHNLGVYDTEAEARKVYDRAKVKYHSM